jgi:hypothetical protein
MHYILLNHRTLAISITSTITPENMGHRIIFYSEYQFLVEKKYRLLVEKLDKEGKDFLKNYLRVDKDQNDEEA